jgi:predicted DNA-binding transcriptional regulator AlpA
MNECTPITKAKAAEILSVSPRTIDNLMASRTLPPHSYIGRKVYWHPDTFFAWLNNTLGVGAMSPLHAGTARPTATPRRRGRPRKSGR